MDHIIASRKLNSEGIVKRLIDTYRGKSQDDLLNIFAPTAALQLIKHLNTCFPFHTPVLADFDSFIMPKNSIKGINAPLVTNKLESPTEWETFPTYLVDRG